MHKLITMALLLVISTLAFSISIYDIQYTTVAGPGNNYPSLYVGQVVSTEGIVSGIGFTGGKYVITEGTGAWKGIFVNDPANSPQLGDKVAITGTVNEVGGMTEIGTLTSYSVISSGNPIPTATTVTPANLQWNTGEAYEGVLIKLVNVRVSVAPIGNNFSVTANNFSCQISNGFFPTGYTWTGIVVNQLWAEITGIVYFAQSQYRTHPRNDDDMIPTADINNITLRAEDVEAKKGETKAVRVFVSRTEESWNLKKYTFKFKFNRRILRFVDADVEGTLSSADPSIELNATEDEVTINYSGDSPIVSPNNNGLLVNLYFYTESYGESVIDLLTGKFSYPGDTTDVDINVAVLADGRIRIPIKTKLAWLSIYNNDYNKKNIFNPYLNQKITIEYGCLVQPGVSSSKAILRIYDSQGRLVVTPINKIIDTASGIETIAWDGRDKNKNLLPVGLYYCHLEVIDRVTGRSDVTTQPVVIGSKLK